MMQNKIIAIYKPKGPTSRDVVNVVKKMAGIKKVGHAGTLDPLASGVLVIGIGREATKQLSSVVKSEKEYLATIKLGQTSTTDDEEGEKKTFNFQLLISKKSKPEQSKVEEILKDFIGVTCQVPPKFSAVKIGGKEAYKRIRKGEEFEMRPREIKIKEIEMLKYQWPYLKIRVVTGPGVYIRSLARDIGRVLGVGGYLSDLERTRVGKFTKEKAITLRQLKFNER